VALTLSKAKSPLIQDNGVLTTLKLDELTTVCTRVTAIHLSASDLDCNNELVLAVMEWAIVARGVLSFEDSLDKTSIADLPVIRSSNLDMSERLFRSSWIRSMSTISDSASVSCNCSLADISKKQCLRLSWYEEKKHFQPNAES
jgi:hypothetical protein